jgi:DtxR family Mn-dependent transcriptional regulator
MSTSSTSTQEPPVLISCRGGTPAAQLAEEVARLLAGRGDAEIGDADALVRGEYAGRRIAVVDGCSSACGARLLVAKGVQPHVALSVDELVKAGEGAPTALAPDAAGRLARGDTSRPLRHLKPRRPAVPDAPAWADTEGSRGHTVEDYLRAIDTLTAPIAECGALTTDAPTLAAYVSKALGVSRVSAGAMLQRLERLGLVERNASKEVLLTAAGRAEADEAVRRLRLLECFVVSFLGYSVADCRQEARTLANSFDLEAIERVRAALGDPERCPHGWPVDPARARAESNRLIVLQAVAVGAQVRIARCAEDDPKLLARLAAAGLAPGTPLEVLEADDRHVVVAVVGPWDGVTHDLDQATATGVIVEPLAPLSL